MFVPCQGSASSTPSSLKFKKPDQQGKRLVLPFPLNNVVVPLPDMVYEPVLFPQLVGLGQLWNLHGYSWSIYLRTDYYPCCLRGPHKVIPSTLPSEDESAP